MTTYGIINIPIKEIIKTSSNKNTADHEYTGQLIKIIETMLDQKYFQFNNKMYKN